VTSSGNSSQLSYNPIGHFSKVRLGPLRRRKSAIGSSPAAGWEVVAWEIAHLGSWEHT